MITACIITKNAQETLSNTLHNLSFVDEMVVVDDYSSDNTREIAKTFNARVYKRHLNSDFAAQRNYALSKAKQGWVLFLDADETLSLPLLDEIKRAIESPKYNGYYIRRDDVFLGKKLKHGETQNTYLLRLAKKGSGIWVRPVHEYWQVNKAKRLKHPILHYPHQTISSFISKINSYTTIEASYRKSKNQKISLTEIIFYPLGKFLYNHIFKLGFLDGFPGFVMSFMMSLHSFMVRVKMFK
jgi:glycosyltransferase involved in cell wall biosynthesis